LGNSKDIELIKKIYKNCGEVGLGHYLTQNNKNIEDVSIKVIVQDTSKVLWKSRKTHFTKIYDNYIRELIKMNKIDLVELGLLTLLSTYMDFENNVLKMDEDTYMFQKDIVEISGLSKTKIIKILENLINNKIIFAKKYPKDNRYNVYYMSPELFFKGQKIDKDIKVFFNELKVD
jgi:hypothetical protein